MSAENRKDERLCREEKIFIEILSASCGKADDSILLECTTQDISLNGLKIRSRYPFIVGAILELLVSFESGGAKYLLTGEVRWLEEMSAESYLAGFELIEAEHSDIFAWHALFSDQAVDQTA